MLELFQAKVDLGEDMGVCSSVGNVSNVVVAIENVIAVSLPMVAVVNVLMVLENYVVDVDAIAIKHLVDAVNVMLNMFNLVLVMDENVVNVDADDYVNAEVGNDAMDVAIRLNL